MKKEYNLSKMKGIKNPYASKKKAAGINLSPKVIDYFKELAKETGVAYPVLINLYLSECVESKRKIHFKWEKTA